MGKVTRMPVEYRTMLEGGMEGNTDLVDSGHQRTSPGTQKRAPQSGTRAWEEGCCPGGSPWGLGAMELVLGVGVGVPKEEAGEWDQLPPPGCKPVPGNASSNSKQEE